MGLIQKRCHGCVGRGEYDQPRAAIAMMMAAGETVGRILAPLVGLMMVLIMRVFERNVAEEHVLMRRRTARAVLHAIDRACERCPGKHKRQCDAEHRTELVYRNHGRYAHDACLSSEFPCGKELGSLVAVTGDMQLRSEARRVGKECVSKCRTWWLPIH